MAGCVEDDGVALDPAETVGDPTAGADGVGDLPREPVSEHVVAATARPSWARRAATVRHSPRELPVTRAMRLRVGCSFTFLGLHDLNAGRIRHS